MDTRKHPSDLPLVLNPLNLRQQWLYRLQIIPTRALLIHTRRIQITNLLFVRCARSIRGLVLLQDPQQDLAIPHRQLRICTPRNLI